MKTKKKRGGWQRWRRETQLPFKDDIGYFYDCKPIVVPNKSKYREHGIITGDRDGNELMRPQELKIVKMEDSETYDPQLILVDMALPEGQRGMRWFRRRAQDFCDRGYKPLKRNDNMTGAGRKKKTRKKRGGKDKGNIKPQTVTGEKKEDPAMVPVNDPFATQPTGLQAVNLPIPPTDLLPPIHDAMVHHTHPLVLDQQRATGEFNRALAGVQNHNYYYYTSSDDNSPVQRRPAQLGDHKHIGSYNQREYRRQRSLARRYGEENPVDGGALHDLNTGINKIQELKHAHQYILIRHRGNLPLLEVKKQNGFRLYRERNTTNDNWSAWKSLGNYDFKNRDSGMRGFLRPHPRGVNRTLGRGGKKKNRKTRRKNKRKTKRNKKRKNKKTRKRKQKGRGVNICQMLSDPERFGYTKKEVRAMALSRAVKARRKIPEGRCVGKRVAQMEGHHYCQEMNNWDDNYKCHEKSGNCVKIIKPRIKKAINDKLRSYGYKL